MSSFLMTVIVTLYSEGMSCEKKEDDETDECLSVSLLVTQFFQVGDFDVFLVVDLHSLLIHV